MVTSQGKSPDTSSGSRQGPIDVSDSEVVPDGHDGGDDAWIPAEAIAQAEAELAPEEAAQDGGAGQRLVNDDLLVRAVLEQGLEGPRHQAFDRELIRYAGPVLKRLVSSGQIRARCLRLGRPVGGLNELYQFTSHDLDDFAQEMIIRALPMFTEAVFVDRRWSPAGGASLTTYFINGCIRHFPDIYRKWQRYRLRNVPRGLDPDPDLASRATDPATIAADTDQAVRMLLQVPDKSLREVVARRAVGYTAREAATDAGLTPKAAEGRLSRLRKTLNEGVIAPGSAGKEGIGGGCSDDTQEA
jgi:DNA-directed RNA polymerase specialized sigma24 family protein